MSNTITIEIDGFVNQGYPDHPFGFLYFTDGTRIGYAPGTRDSDEDGLFDIRQPYLTDREGLMPQSQHWELARSWSRKQKEEKGWG